MKCFLNGSLKYLGQENCVEVAEGIIYISSLNMIRLRLPRTNRQPRLVTVSIPTKVSNQCKSQLLLSTRLIYMPILICFLCHSLPCSCAPIICRRDIQTIIVSGATSPFPPIVSFIFKYYSLYRTECKSR